MNGSQVINSNADFFNTVTGAGGTWRRKTISKRADNVEAVMGSNSVQGYPAERELPQPTELQSGVCARDKRWATAIPRPHGLHSARAPPPRARSPMSATS